MKILVIEDNKDISEFLKSSLEDECFAVDVANDGEKGVFMARTNDYSVIILDCVLPKKSGRQVCKEIREKKKDVFIIIASVKSEIGNKVDLFEIGADDYIIKPFSFEELLARIHALLRRPRIMQEKTLNFNSYSFDTKNYLLKKGEHIIYLTRKESMILEFLVKNKGKIISRSMLFENVWDIKGDSFSNAIEMHIRNIRHKLDDQIKKRIIKTFPGRGYMIEG